MLGEVRGSADDSHSDVPRHGDGDHVLVDDLAELNARVVPLRNDVDDHVAHYDVELDVGVGRQEAEEQRAREDRVRRRPDEETKVAARHVTQLSYRSDGGSYLLQRRP
jgi:hypothetical protein